MCFSIELAEIATYQSRQKQSQGTGSKLRNCSFPLCLFQTVATLTRHLIKTSSVVNSDTITTDVHELPVKAGLHASLCSTELGNVAL